MRMVDLIRAQQKGRKSASRPAKPAPIKTEPESEPEGDVHTSEPTKETWKAALATVSPPPEEPPIFVRERSSPTKLYAAAIECLRIIYDAARRRESFAIEPAAQMAEQLAKAMTQKSPQRALKESLTQYETLILQTLSTNGEKRHLVHQGLNVAIYALKIGDVLNYSLVKLTELALAGMVHDIGLTRLPNALLSKSELLSESERALIHQHSIQSYEILRGLGQTWEWLAEVVLQHHEREDGTGYPKGLQGAQIHEYAKIIGLCGIYEAMVHARPHRGALAPFDVVRQILQTERQHFSQAILKAFLSGIASYPVGSWVRLNTKEIGRVISTNKANPLRPVLEIWADASGEKLPQPRLLDLSKEILVHIIGPATEETQKQ